MVYPCGQRRAIYRARPKQRRELTFGSRGIRAGRWKREREREAASRRSSRADLAALPNGSGRVNGDKVISHSGIPRNGEKEKGKETFIVFTLEVRAPSIISTRRSQLKSHTPCAHHANKHTPRRDPKAIFDPIFFLMVDPPRFTVINANPTMLAD